MSYRGRFIARACTVHKSSSFWKFYFSKNSLFYIGIQDILFFNLWMILFISFFCQSRSFSMSMEFFFKFKLEFRLLGEFSMTVLCFYIARYIVIGSLYTAHHRIIIWRSLLSTLSLRVRKTSNRLRPPFTLATGKLLVGLSERKKTTEKKQNDLIRFEWRRQTVI